MADVPEGYQQVPEEDRKKAQVFFGHGRTVAGTGNFDYAISMFLQGVEKDPDAVEGHAELRDISLRRKASGGKSLGMMDAMKLKRPTKEDKTNMLNAEKLLAYDPGNTDHMVALLQSAQRAGYYDTVLWIGPILQKANSDSPKEDFNKYIILKDVYKGVGEWKLAADACAYALRLRPNDMDLATEMKNIGAQDTMQKGKYGTAKTFRDSVKDMDKQKKLMDSDKDVNDVDAMAGLIKDAERELAANPDDAAKVGKVVDLLEKTELPENEARAIDLLQRYYDRTKQFRYRLRIGQVHIKQMMRLERAKRAEYAANPADEKLKAEYLQVRREQAELELSEFELAAEAYPTETKFRFEVGKRLFLLHRFGDAIPVFQQSRNDPKVRAEAGVLLGRSFLEAGFVDEADETFAAIIADHVTKGDLRSKEMYYWRARTLEQKQQNAEAIKLYSQVAQWDFNYLDVQTRIKRLRSGGSSAPQPTA